MAHDSRPDPSEPPRIERRECVVAPLIGTVSGGQVGI
jgi:hypothetical protein